MLFKIVKLLSGVLSKSLLVDAPGSLYSLVVITLDGPWLTDDDDLPGSHDYLLYVFGTRNNLCQPFKFFDNRRISTQKCLSTCISELVTNTKNRRILDKIPNPFWECLFPQGKLLDKKRRVTKSYITFQLKIWFHQLFFKLISERKSGPKEVQRVRMLNRCRRYVGAPSKDQQITLKFSKPSKIFFLIKSGFPIPDESIKNIF